MDTARIPEAGSAQPRPWWKKKRYVIPLGLVGLLFWGAMAENDEPEEPTAGKAAQVTEATAPEPAPEATAAPEPPAETVAPPEPAAEETEPPPEVATEDRPSEEPEQPAPPPTAEDGALAMSAANIDPWPFTVDQGVLRCEGNAVTFTPEGGPVYAVNGVAETQEAGLDLEQIWQEDPEIPGLRVNVGPLIAAGLDLC